MTQKPPIFFVHVPKTAGTSWRNSVAHLEGIKLLCDYGPHSDLTTPELTTQAYGNGCAQELLDAAGDQRIVIAGHVGYDKYQHLSTQETTVTIFRNPVERLVSEYQHVMRSDPEAVTDFAEFVERDGHRNRHDKLIFGIQPQQAQVGLSSHYADFIFLLRRRLDIDAEPRTDNVTPTQALDTRTEFPVDVVRHAFALNSRDLELVYETAAIMETRLRAEGVLTRPQAAGSFQLRLSRDGHLEGILQAQGLDTGFVSLRLNGEERAITSLHRTDSESGAWVFRYPLALLGATSGDTVSAELLELPSTRDTLKVT